MNLTDYRHELNWSVNQAANTLGINERSIRRMENNDIPTPKAVLLLCEYMVIYGTIKIITRMKDR